MIFEINSLTMRSIIISLIFLYNVCNAIDVKTSSGLVRGHTVQVLNQSVNEFLGIPFAEPPIGDLRFAKPKPIVKPLTGIIDATKMGKSCYQMQPTDVLIETMGNIIISEDCLVLNVWSQSSYTNFQNLKPVMFWIFGGGLAMGSIFEPQYNGSVLATQDVVFVSANYRLGPFGFVYGNDSTAPGNVQFYDQVLALKWVRDNIHLFGGDKDQITIFGESAGSWSVSAHLLSPESKGLFRRAVMESGAFLFNKDRPVISKSEALSSSIQLAERLNCTEDKTWLKCLRNVSPHEVLDKFIASKIYPIVGTDFMPELTQKAFTDYQFNRDLDLMAGVTKDEGSALVFVANPEIFINNSVKRDDFEIVAQKANQIYYNIDIENITQFYLNGVKPDDSEAIKWKIYNFYGDITLKCPTYLFAKQYSEDSTRRDNVFFYELTYTADKSTENLFGVVHGADIPFVFGQPLLHYNSNASHFTEKDIHFSQQVMKYWTNFAKYGDKKGEWTPLSSVPGFPSLVKNLNPNEEKAYFTDLFAKTCEGVWSNYFWPI